MPSTVWRGHLTFGLISIPIRLFRAARAERIALKKIGRVPARSSGGAPVQQISEARRRGEADRAQTEESAEDRAPVSIPFPARDNFVPLRQTYVEKDAGATTAAPEITRGVEVRPNQFVEVPAEDLKSLRAATSTDFAIQEFVALSEIDPLYFETSYYVVPEEVGEKAYALLYRALQNAKMVALAELAMHGRDHLVVLRPGSNGLVAHTMFYVSEVHLDEQFRADASLVSKGELDLAERLIASLTASFEPDKYVNGYQQRLRALVEEKVGTVPAAVPEATSKSNVIDIADALRRSLAQLKKPVQKTEDVSGTAKAAPRKRKHAGAASSS